MLVDKPTTMNNYSSKIISLLAFVLLLSVAAPLFAEEEKAEGEAKPEPELQYYQIEPDVVTNYMRTGNKLGFIVIQVNIATIGEANLLLLEEHDPLIRDVLIAGISNMTQDQVTDLDAREKVRLALKEALAKELEAETGKKLVEDIFFTKYTYQ